MKAFLKSLISQDYSKQQLEEIMQKKIDEQKSVIEKLE